MKFTGKSNEFKKSELRITMENDMEYGIKTKNDPEYDLMEKRANKIYDKYHKNHVPSSQRGKGIIIADNPDTAEICHEMFNTTFVDREHLVLNIISLLLALEEIVNEDNIPSNTKVKL